ALLRSLRRDKVQDPFGGDDMFDGESRFAGKGPKVALIASGVLFLLLVGGVGFMVASGDKTAAPTNGSFADLQVDDSAAQPSAPPAPTPPAPTPPHRPPAPGAVPPAAPAPRVHRRPWLPPTPPPNNAPRLGAGGGPNPAPAAAATAAATPPPADMKVAAVTL